MWLPCCAFGLAWGLLFPPPLAGKADSRLLETVQTAHRSSVQAIQSFSCRFRSQDDTGQGHFDESGEYWRSLDAVRIRSKYIFPDGVTTNTTDYFVERGRVLLHNIQASDRGKHRDASGSIYAAPLQGPDLWRMTFFTFNEFFDPPMTLDELVGRPNKVLRVQQVSQWGHEVIYISVELPSSSKRRLELWLDPQYNYLARKLVSHGKSTFDGKGWSREDEVVHFTEAAPGIYFPERIDSRSSMEGHPEGSGTKTFTQIRVNESLPPEIFEFRFPAGIEVLDSIESKVYKVSSAGKLEEMKDRPAFNISSGFQSVHNSAEEVVEPARRIPGQQPRNTTMMLLTALIAGLVAVDAWLLLRRNNQPLASSAQSRAERMESSTTNES